MLQAVWVEIPASDIARAVTFYRSVLDLTPEGEIVEDDVRQQITLVNTENGGGTGISLNQTASFEPGASGPLVYLMVEEELETVLERVVPAGGTVVEGRTSMGDAGSYATFRDSEGNTLALYTYP